MANDLEAMLKDLFGESMTKVSQFQSDQMTRFKSRVQEAAREALKDDFARLTTEISDLRERVARLESEQHRIAAESVEPSF